MNKVKKNPFFAYLCAFLIVFNTVYMPPVTYAAPFPGLAPTAQPRRARKTSPPTAQVSEPPKETLKMRESAMIESDKVDSMLDPPLALDEIGSIAAGSAVTSAGTYLAGAAISGISLPLAIGLAGGVFIATGFIGTQNAYKTNRAEIHKLEDLLKTDAIDPVQFSDRMGAKGVSRSVISATLELDACRLNNPQEYRRFMSAQVQRGRRPNLNAPKKADPNTSRFCSRPGSSASSQASDSEDGPT